VSGRPKAPQSNHAAIDVMVSGRPKAPQSNHARASEASRGPQGNSYSVFSNS